MYKNYDLYSLYLLKQNYVTNRTMTDIDINVLDKEIALRTCRHFHIIEYVYYKKNDYYDPYDNNSKKIIFVESTYKCIDCSKYLRNDRPKPSVITRYEYIEYQSLFL